jgi:hypothetical protein
MGDGRWKRFFARETREWTRKGEKRERGGFDGRFGETSLPEL